MPDLYACYFCGAVDDSLDTYAVLPSWLDPEEDEQVTVAACEACHEKLARVVSPLVRRLEDETDGAPGDTGGEPGTSLTGERGDEPGTEGDDDRDGITFGWSDESAGLDSNADAEDAASTPGETTRNERTDGVESGAGSRDENGVDEQSAEERPSTGHTGGLASDVDVATFRRVMRLLQNREFPVAREEFETLAASAYDLDDEEVGRIVEAAIERDLLAEEGEYLVRPERRGAGAGDR